MILATYYAGRIKIVSEELEISEATIQRGLNGELLSHKTAKKIFDYLESHLKTFDKKKRILQRCVDSLREKL